MKSLYYCRSLSIQRADKGANTSNADGSPVVVLDLKTLDGLVSEAHADQVTARPRPFLRIAEPAAAQEENQYEECLACQ